MSRNYKLYIPLFDRGFTGHVKQPFGLRISANQLRMLIPQRNECGKMLDVFGLINMLSNAKSRSEALAGNGRMYDPVLGRMLSPDNFMQAPDYTQSFNRYSYCWNNPLKYIDPTGNELGLIKGNGGYGYYLGYGGGIGPGSGNHWSDQYRSVYGNFMLMSSSIFQSYYNVSSSSYNQIVSNYKSLPRNSSNFQTGPNGTLGFYASNTYATLIKHFEQYDKSNTWTVTESWEVIAPWVSLGAAQGQGGNLLKDLTDITGWASTIRTAGEMDWDSMTKAQQQKVAYNMQKSLKSNGTRMYTRDIKANINGNFKSLNYKLGAASGALIIADVYMKGEIRPSHVVNGIMTGVGLTVWGSPVAAVYFITDLGVGLFYDGGLSGYIDDTWGSPLYEF